MAQDFDAKGNENGDYALVFDGNSDYVDVHYFLMDQSFLSNLFLNNFENQINVFDYGLSNATKEVLFETGIKASLNVSLAHVSLSEKELRIQSDAVFDINDINNVVSNLGDYRIRDNNPSLFSNIILNK